MNNEPSLADGDGSSSDQGVTSNNQKRNKLTFVLKDGNKIQTLIVKPISEYKISFVLSVDGPCKKSIAGVAVGVEGDYEMEDDGKGDTYPAIAYVYRGKDDYELSMSLAVETKGYKRDKAILLEAEDRSGCPVTVKTMSPVK